MFPNIQHIDDIYPFIANKDEFKIRRKNGLIVVDYVIQKENTFDTPEARECRGIKFWENTGDIAARPLNKFFNRGERSDLEEEWFDSSFRMFEKLDGSLIHFLPVGAEWRAMTKAGITDVSEKCEEEIGLSPKFFDTLTKYKDITFCFEYTSPNNRIVIKYDKPALTLIAARDKVNGAYYPLDPFAEELGVERVKECKGTLEEVKSWLGAEGVVLVWPNGYRLKVKADDYVLKNKTKDNLGQEKNLLSLVLDDSVDDLSSILDAEDWQKVMEYHRAVWQGIKSASELVDSVVTQAKKCDDRKEAAEIIKSSLSGPLVPCGFQGLDGRDNTDSVVGIVRKHLSSSTKLENVRDIIGAVWHEQGEI